MDKNKNMTITPSRGRPSSGKPPLTLECFEEKLTEWGIDLRFNVLSNEIDARNIRDWSSPDVSMLSVDLYSELIKTNTHVTLPVVDSYMLRAARKRSYNPVLNLICDAQWDGADRLQEVYEILGVTEDELSKTLIKKWFWQGLRLLHNTPEAPVSADGVLALAGDQGIGKTSFFRQIAIEPHFFRSGQSIGNYDKDDRRRVVTTWICELGELDCTLKSDMGKLKAFLTQEYDEYRLPYAREDTKNPRRTNLAATVNGSRFLVDPTGNRRFWVVPVERIDLEGLYKLDALQLWRQVYEQYYLQAPDGFRLTRDEQKQLAERNGEFDKPLKAEDEIRDIFERFTDREYTTVTEFQSCFGCLQKYTAKQVSEVLDKMGVQRELRRIDGKVGRYRYLPKRRIMRFED